VERAAGNYADAARVFRVNPPPLMDFAADAHMVAAAQGGDRAAFTALYRRYSRMVHGVLLARVPHSEADDLLQDVFLSAYKRLGGLRDPAAFGGWLLAIARNAAADFFRRRPAMDELATDYAAPSGASPHPSAEAAAAVAAVRSLPEAYRETLILRLVEGMSGAEIAARTGLTPASVRVNLHRGMKMLREKLGMSERP